MNSVGAMRRARLCFTGDGARGLDDPDDRDDLDFRVTVPDVGTGTDTGKTSDVMMPVRGGPR